MQKVIITGTSRGIGFELAQLFAENTYKVLALSRNIDPLLYLNNPHITAISVDVCSQNDLQKSKNTSVKNGMK